MGLRFRKSIKIGKHTRINLSKSGVGLSTGLPGARISVNQKGIRKTLSIPGTGISYSDYSSHKSKKKKSPKKEENYNLPRLETKNVVQKIFSKNDPVNKSKELYNQGASYMENKDFQKAKECFQKAIDLDENNYYANLFLASILYDEANYKEAILKILDLEEKDLLGINILVNSYYKLNEYENVIELLKDSKDISDEYKFVLGMSYYNLEKYKKASEVFKSGPVLKRTYTEDVLNFKYYLGMSYLKLDDIEKAKRQFVKIYENNSDFKDIVEIAQNMNFAVGEHI